MVRTCGAIHADDADTNTFKNGKCRADVGAKQHLAGQVKGDLRLDGEDGVFIFEGAMNTLNNSFYLKDILRGFDEQEVYTSLDKAAGLLAEDLSQLIKADVGHLGVICGN